MFLDTTKFAEVVKVSPLISIDFCIISNECILLGERKNPPAKGYYFVPGGRILKNESILESQKRILKNEVGLSLEEFNSKSLKFINIFEHFYSDNFLGSNNYDTHYVVLAYQLNLKSKEQIDKKKIYSQHSSYKWQDLNNSKKNISFDHKIHEYTINYFRQLFL